MKIKFNQWNCTAVGMLYGSGNRAIQLIDAEDHEPIAVATVNMEPYRNDGKEILDDEIFVKDYSENSGMTESLLRADIIKPEIITTLSTACNGIII